MVQTFQTIDSKDHTKLHAFIEKHLAPKEHEKKMFGEVFTPLWLVKDMLDGITKYVDKNYWTNPSLKILDPAAGIGNFPIVAYELLMEGLKVKIPKEEKRKKHILENMLYMVELNPINARLLKRIFNDKQYKLNILCTSFLDSTNGLNNQQLHDHKILNKWKETKFDLIMGNPPFQLGKNSNFYVQFIELSAKIGKSFAFICPNRFLIPYHIANTIILNLNPIYIIHTVNNAFNVNTKIGYFIANNKEYSGKTLCNFNNINKFINLNKPTPTLTNSYDVKLISDKILLNKYTKIVFHTEKPVSGYYIFIKRQWIRYSSKKMFGGHHIFNISDEENDGKFIWLNSKKEKLYMTWYISRCIIIRFITSIYATNMNVPPFLWNYIPYPINNYSNNDYINEYNLQKYVNIINQYID